MTELKNYFHENGYLMAEAAFDLLLKEKNGKWRKDNVTPSIAHEIDQIMMLKNAIENGTIKENELENNQLKRMLSATILHDIGEDFRYWYNDIVRELKAGIREKSNDENIFQQYQTEIKKVAQMVEVLTHYRKFTPQQIKELFGDQVDIPTPTNGKVTRLPDIENRLRGRFQASGCNVDSLQAFIKISNDGEPLIIIGRHGMRNILGQDWNSYTEEIKKNLETSLIKGPDRMHGMATRPALATTINKVTEYGKYIVRSRILFSDTVHLTNVQATPFTAFINSWDPMMGVLDQIGRLYTEHHPLLIQEGNIGINPVKLGPIDFSQYLPQALIAYKGLDPKHHPLIQLLTQIQEQIPMLEQWSPFSEKDGKSAPEHFYNNIVTSLLAYGGSEMEQLLEHANIIQIEKNETTQPACQI